MSVPVSGRPGAVSSDPHAPHLQNASGPLTVPLSDALGPPSGWCKCLRKCPLRTGKVVTYVATSHSESWHLQGHFRMHLHHPRGPQAGITCDSCLGRNHMRFLPRQESHVIPDEGCQIAPPFIRKCCESQRAKTKTRVFLRSTTPAGAGEGADLVAGCCSYRLLLPGGEKRLRLTPQPL